MFQKVCSFVHKENVLLKINVNYPLDCPYIDYAYLIRLCDVTKPTKWPLPLESICKYSNAHKFHIFQLIKMKLVSKSMFQRALSYKTYY